MFDGMKKTEIYSSRKKAFWVLVISLLFVIGGVYMVLEAENFDHQSDLGVRIAGVLGILFFGLGIFVAIGRIVRNKLILVIDSVGIDVNPEKSPSERIEWKNIEGFDVIGGKGAKIILIIVNNPGYWIEREQNPVRKKMMKFNLGYCGTPFSVSANATRSSHDELLKILNESRQKYRS